jgi:hypothetical protein
MAERELLDTPISAMIERTLRDEVQQLADDGDRSFSAEVRRALRWYVIAEAAYRERGSAA